MKKIDLQKHLQTRKKLQNNIDKTYEITSENQVNLTNKLYLDCSFNEKHCMLKELRDKHNGYRHQDKDKEIYDISTFITIEEIIEKLVASCLKCCYCKNNISILYKNSREPYQWTLDRINNNLDHSNINTVISCLKCNLERRKKNIEKFKFTKQLNLIKKE